MGQGFGGKALRSAPLTPYPEPHTDSLSKTVFSVKPLFKRFKRFESVLSRGALRSEKTDL